MADWLVDRWNELPTWAKWTVGVGVILTLDAIRMAWGERRFVAALAESFVANLLYWGLVAGGLAAAIWIGVRVAITSHKSWLGWVVGVVTYLGSGFILLPIFQQIPGVGWRFESLFSSDCYVDWDGRSNPTVCE